jgi:DNA-binding response OmpR family regulator
MKVLVVEDDRTLAGLVETVARSRGHEVEVFDSVIGVKHAIDLPCTILLDLTLVEGDAASLVREIKADPRTSAARVVLLSGSRELETVAAECGADAWLKKPFGLAELEGVMKRDEMKNGK